MPEGEGDGPLAANWWAERGDNVRSAERLLKRFDRGGSDPRAMPEVVELLAYREAPVRLLTIRFLALAGREAPETISLLERMRDDHDAEIRLQAEAARKRIREDTAGHRI